MFNNQIFDSWLNKKSDEILSKVDRETISTEEMIILVLKAQTNHFYHTDIDLKKGLSDIDNKMEKGHAELDTKIEKLRVDVDKRFEQVDARIDSVERRIDAIDHKIDNRFMWTIGITITMSLGIYLKLFLG